MPVTQKQEIKTIVTMVCDVCKVTYSFVEEDSPDNLPEGAVRFLAIARMSTYGLPPDTPSKIAICSKFCGLKFFQDYEPARKPTTEEIEKLKQESTSGPATN